MQLMTMIRIRGRLDYGEIIMDTFIDRGIPPRPKISLGDFEVVKEGTETGTKISLILKFLRTLLVVIMIGLQLYIISQLL